MDNSDTPIEIKDFKKERISKIIANDTPVPLHEGGKIILHLIPMNSFSPTSSLDIKKITCNETQLRPIDYGKDPEAPMYRINFDGLLACDLSRTYSYTQLYRNGIIEAVHTLWNGSNGKETIEGPTYEQRLLNSLTQYLSLLKKLGISPPIFVFLTMTGVKDYKMAVDGLILECKNHPIDRDILNLPEHFLESYEKEPVDILRPMFDLIWNACGHERSLNFGSNGKLA